MATATATRKYTISLTLSEEDGERLDRRAAEQQRGRAFLAREAVIKELDRLDRVDLANEKRSLAVAVESGVVTIENGVAVTVSNGVVPTQTRYPKTFKLRSGRIVKWQDATIEDFEEKKADLALVYTTQIAYFDKIIAAMRADKVDHFGELDAAKQSTLLEF